MQEQEIWQFLHALVFLWGPQWIVPPYSAAWSTSPDWSMLAPVSLSSLTCFLNCCQNMSMLHNWRISYTVTHDRIIWRQQQELCTYVPVLQSGAHNVNVVDQAKNSTQGHFCQHLKTEGTVSIFILVTDGHLWCTGINVAANNYPWRFHLVKNNF